MIIKLCCGCLSHSRLYTVTNNGEIKGLSSLLTHTSFAETEVLVKKELPGQPIRSNCQLNVSVYYCWMGVNVYLNIGRTLDFTLDLSTLPMIGERYLLHHQDRSSQARPGGVHKKDGQPLSSSSVSSAGNSAMCYSLHHICVCNIAVHCPAAMSQNCDLRCQMFYFMYKLMCVYCPNFLFDVVYISSVRVVLSMLRCRYYLQIVQLTGEGPITHSHESVRDWSIF